LTDENIPVKKTRLHPSMSHLAKILAPVANLAAKIGKIGLKTSFISATSGASRRAILHGVVTHDFYLHESN